MEKEKRLLEVSGHQTRKEGMTQHTIYTIKKGSDLKTVEKKYKDFEILRAKLAERWPGIFIPEIQPKKTVGRTEEEIANNRKSELNRFIKKIEKIDYLYYSDEIENFFDAQVVLKSENYETIANKYKNAFQDFDSNFNEDSDEVKTHLKSFFEKIKNIKAKTTELLSIVTDLKLKEQKNKEMFLNTIEQFHIFEKDALMEYVNNDCNQLVLFNMNNDPLLQSIVNFIRDSTNPFDSFLSKLTDDLLDEDALLSAFDSLQNLKSILAKPKKVEQKNGNNMNDNSLTALREIIKISTWHLNKETKLYNELTVSNYSKEIAKMKESFASKDQMKGEILSAVLGDKNINSIQLDKSVKV